MLVHPDGSRTVTMTVRLDATKVSRVTTVRVDAQFRPLDAYQMLWTEGEFRGSGYFWVEGQILNAVVTANTGTLQQTVEVPKRFSWVTHPLGADGLHMWYFDEQGPRVQTATVYNTDTLGKSLGSILGRVHDVKLELLGEEEIDVPAGRFLTKKYLMDERLEIWVGVEDPLMVKMRNQSKDRLYELVELSRTDLR